MRKALVLLALLLCVPGCPPQQDPFAQSGPAELQTFASPTDLEAYFRLAVLGPDPTSDNPDASPTPFVSYYPGETVSCDIAAEAIGGLAGTPVPDPADLPAPARSDGSFIYMLTGYDLSVIQATPAEQLQLAGRFELDGWPAATGLYLVDGRAVLITEHSYAYDFPWWSTVGDSWLADDELFYEVALIDLQDPADPQLLRHYWFQGQPLASRLVDGRLVLVSASYPGGVGTGTLIDPARKTTADILPRFRMIDETGRETIGPLVTWDKLLRPANMDGSAIVSVIVLDVAGTPTTPAAAGVMTFWQYLYLSPTAVYLTNTEYDPAGRYRTDTEIHKISLAGPVPIYAASGTIEGRPLYYNYPIFSEKDGRLWVISSRMDAPGYDLLILEPIGNKLHVAGRLDNIPPDMEGAFFTFLGDHLLVDDYDPASPGYHVDLSDPRFPTPTGRLSEPLPGGYMHLLDPTHLLIIGHDGQDASGSCYACGDLTLWMYDVADFARPVLLHKEVIGSPNTSSTATSHPQEVLIANGLLALQVNLYEGNYPPDVGIQTFGGLYIYRLSLENGFERLGRIETANAYYSSSWQRVFLLDDAIYAVSSSAVKAAARDHPDQVISNIRVPGL